MGEETRVEFILCPRVALAFLSFCGPSKRCAFPPGFGDLLVDRPAALAELGRNAWFRGECVARMGMTPKGTPVPYGSRPGRAEDDEKPLRRRKNRQTF